MKKNLFFLFLFFLLVFFSPKKILADHACYESCGEPSYCNSGLTCVSGICKNAACLSQTDCSCEPYTVQGLRVLIPGNQIGIEPFRSAALSINPSGGTFTEEDPAVKPRKAYFYTGLNGKTSYTITIANIPGAKVGYTACYNDINCHNNTPVDGNSFTTNTNKVDSENFGPEDPFHYIDLWWHYTPLIPNCKNIKVNNSNLPYTVLAGDTITLTADYENLNGPVTSVGMVVNPQGSCSFSPLNASQSGGAGTYSFNWTPTSAGNYDVFCRAWNDGVAECRGMCVDGPPRYQCPGSDGNGATSYGTIIVQNPGPWYKLKNASLNKIGNHDIAVVQNVNSFDYDDPPNSRYTIINSTNSDPGILLATNTYNPGPSYNPIPDSTKGWHISSYGNISQPMLDNFYQYIISRKIAKEINNLNEINADGIYIIKSNDLNLSNPNFNFVLIIRNLNNTDLANANITVNSFNSSNKSIMILAKKITFSSSVTTAAGIFIAQTVEYQSTNGLKVLGNLISKTAVTLQSRSDNTRPSLFIVFKPQMYLDLLPYLSVSKYDWRRLQ